MNGAVVNVGGRNSFLRVRDRLILIGMILGVAFWIIEAAMHAYVFHRLDLVDQIFSPGLHEAWMRVIIVAMFVGLGYYGQKLITVRKRNQRALAAANAELAQVFNTAADGMRIVDRNFTIIRANHTFCSMAGVSPGDVAGKKCYEVFFGSLCHTDSCPLVLILGGEGRVESDTEKLGAAGTRTPCIVTATPFRGPSGELIGIVEDFKDISERKRSEEALRQSGERLQELASYLQSAREKERTRIAREIHDELGQSLTALKMELDWFVQRLPKADELLVKKSEALEGLVEANIHLVQRISSELRPGLLDHLGLSAALEWQAGQFSSRTGVACSVLSEPEDIVLESAPSTALFRIFQEALTNVSRHSGATRVEVVLRAGAREVLLEIRDNGRGITGGEMSSPGAFGLMGIRERAQSLGGTAKITGSPQRGTTVQVLVPWEGTRDETGD